MNKQEAINELMSKSREIIFGDDENVYLSRKRTIELVSQIDEPQKVVVPKFIDSFIKYTKAEGMSLFIAMDNAQNKESEWIITHEETFARAWLDGYEIEKERLYTVEIPNPNGDSNRYGLCKVDGKIIVGSFVFGLDRANNAKLTESEIKQDFEWAWQFAKEVEEN